jgi:predicted amidohydrolase YtcJ
LKESAGERLILANCQAVDFAKGETRRVHINVDRDKIAKVIPGSTRLVRGIRALDLKGRYVIPGFTDSHAHLMAHGIELQRIDLGKCRSADDCLEKLRNHRDRPEIFGVNWDESGWVRGKKEDIDRSALDRINPAKPVIMRRVCGHFAIVNTPALKRIGPKWKIVDRKKGYLYEDAALFLNLIFSPSDEMLEKGLDMAMEEALSLGVTSLHEITNIRNFKMFQSLRSRLRVRVALYTYWEVLDAVIEAGFQSGIGDNYLKFQGIKIFMDGSIGARTAAMTKPYPGTNNSGKLLVDKERLKKMICKAEKNSLQLIIHSLGDRATETVIRAFEELRVKGDRLRHRIEHLEVVSDRQIERIARLGLYASMQPNFTRRWQQPEGLYEQYLGSGYRKMNPFRKVVAAGIPLVFGSDSMPMGPLFGLTGAIQHPNPSCRLDPARAFGAYTERPAYAVFEEGRIGRIETGMLCDLAVLDRNPLAVSDSSLIKVENVILGGQPFKGG